MTNWLWFAQTMAPIETPIADRLPSSWDYRPIYGPPFNAETTDKVLFTSEDVDVVSAFNGDIVLVIFDEYRNNRIRYTGEEREKFARAIFPEGFKNEDTQDDR